MKHIKEGEEFKKKHYRALCSLKEPATVEDLQKLDIPEGFTINQITPLRVLHRRPLLTRPRNIYSVKAYVDKGMSLASVLMVVSNHFFFFQQIITR